MAREPGNSRSSAAQSETLKLLCQSTGRPCSASLAAGSITSAKDLRPKRSSASASPATEPGMQMDS